MKWLALAVVLAACGSSSPHARAPEDPATPAVRTDATAIDPDGDQPITSEEVSFTSADGHVVPGTLTHPTAPGRHPAVLFLAGSGPTDRNWESPLLPGTNGSGRLLAEALAKRGVVTLRIDKAGVGANKASLANATFDIYRDEGRAALAFLRRRPDVAPSKLYLAGHSEGGMHAIRIAEAEGSNIAGLLLLSATGRSMETLILAQLESQLRAAVPAQADKELASIKHALDEFLAGKPVDARSVSSIPGLQMLVQSIVNPASATLARSMLAWDPLPEMAKLGVHIFVYNGAHDVQVDPTLDAKALAAANPQAELFIAPEADHILKHETRSMPELRANIGIVQTQMNAADRVLDPASLDAITSWLIAH